MLLLTAVLMACGSSGSTKPQGLHAPKFLVALDETSSADNVNVFSVDATTGKLTAVSGSPFTTGLSGGFGAVVHPTHGNWVFAADFNGNVQALVIGSDGKPTVASTASSGYSDFSWISGMAVSADGKYLYTTTDGTDLVEWSINQSSGALTKIGPYTTPLSWVEGVASSGGFLYVNDGSSSNRQVHVASIGSDGALTNVQTVTVPVPVGVSGSDLWTVTPDKAGKFLFVGDENCTITTYSIGSDGKLTFVGAATRTNPGTGQLGDGDMDFISVSLDNKFVYTTTDRTGLTAVFAIQADGNLKEITGSPFLAGTYGSSGTTFSGFGSVIVDPSNSFVYATEDGSDIVALTRNKTDGSLTPVAFQSDGVTPLTYTTKYTNAESFVVTW